MCRVSRFITRRKTVLWLVCMALAAISIGSSATAEEEAVFSGPQVGEVLPPLTIRNVLGPDAGQESNPVEQADGKPILLIFVHERTRPAFGLANLLARFAATRDEAGLKRAMVFLSDDATVTENWMKSIPTYFEKDTPAGISVDGAEGPGAYGLNRNVALTILVGKEGRTTANFALVQPSIQADGYNIMKAVVDVTGGGAVPDIAKFMPQGMTDRARPVQTPDGKLRELLRVVIQKDASDVDVTKAAKAVEEYVKENSVARTELGRITTTVVGSQRFDTYGTQAARDKLKEWAKTYGTSDGGQDSDKKPAPAKEKSENRPAAEDS